MAKKLIAVESDMSEAYVATGFIQGVAGAITTDKHINAVMDVLFTEMNMEFLEYMDAYAASAPDRFHHVYEWDMVGVPSGRLFKPVMRGRGRNRYISWRWRASKKLVPVEPDAEAAGVKKIHVFVWKAPFMEYNTDGVTIEPKRHDFISAFTRDANHGFKLVKGPVHVANPGGPEVRGAFTTAFAEWWGRGSAHESFVRRSQIVQERLKTMPIATTARKSKGFSFNVGSANKLLADGQAAGRKFIEEQTKNYIGQAAQRLAFMGEDTDD